MLIIPAIDLKSGKVVRLFQGKYEKETVYSQDAEGIARGFEEQGARLIHVVDLDGAKSGRPENLHIVESVAKTVSIPIELGGGIRTRETADEALKRGVSRVIIGTRAVKADTFVKELVAEFGNRVIAGVDAAGGVVRVEGWTKGAGVSVSDLLKRLEENGVETIIYTDTGRDGTLTGPNMEEIKKVLESTKMKVVASGGVSSYDDLRKLSVLEEPGLAGIIVGKALYERRIDLREAIIKYQN